MGKTYTFFFIPYLPELQRSIEKLSNQNAIQIYYIKKGLINKRKLMTSFVFTQTIYIFGIANKQIILKRK